MTHFRRARTSTILDDPELTESWGSLLFRFSNPMLWFSRSDLVANRSAGKQKRGLVVEEFEGPVRLLNEGVQLKCAFCKLDRCPEPFLGYPTSALPLPTNQPPLPQPP